MDRSRHCGRADALVANGHDRLWCVLALALYTGQRLGDVLAMRWDQVHGGRINAVVQAKTGKVLTIPVHKDLQGTLAALPRVGLTVLTTSRGTPWTVNGFQATWRKAKPACVRDAGLVVHGLRKSAVVFMLEAGCSVAETSAMTGQSFEMVAHYAKMVNQAQLASAAILKWERAPRT